MISQEAAAAKTDLQKYERAEVEVKETEKHLNQKRKKISKLIHDVPLLDTANGRRRKR